MNAIATRSPRMGWLGVQTCCNALYCWTCAAAMQHHGAMLEPEDVLADDRCDRCGVVLLTQQYLSNFCEDRQAFGIRLRKVRWHERLRRWWSTPTE